MGKIFERGKDIADDGSARGTEEYLLVKSALDLCFAFGGGLICLTLAYLAIAVYC
jgi:hypothetical protein